jgi:hypothetical protein
MSRDDRLSKGTLDQHRKGGHPRPCLRRAFVRLRFEIEGVTFAAAPMDGTTASIDLDAKSLPVERGGKRPERPALWLERFCASRPHLPEVVTGSTRAVSRSTTGEVRPGLCGV